MLFEKQMGGNRKCPHNRQKVQVQEVRGWRQEVSSQQAKVQVQGVRGWRQEEMSSQQGKVHLQAVRGRRQEVSSLITVITSQLRRSSLWRPLLARGFVHATCVHTRSGGR
jgi:hypothetical protein